MSLASKVPWELLEPGLRYALEILAYHERPMGGEPVVAYSYAIRRVRNTIEAELENGGPLTSALMAGEP